MRNTVVSYYGLTLFVFLLLLPRASHAQATSPQSSDDSNVRPPISKADLQIVNRESWLQSGAIHD